jgi:hypothetical protein
MSQTEIFASLGWVLLFSVGLGILLIRVLELLVGMDDQLSLLVTGQLLIENASRLIAGKRIGTLKNKHG